MPGAGSIMCLNRVDCLDSVITARMPGGGRFHSHCTVAGKAILAFLPDEEIRAIIKHGMLRFTSATLGLPKALGRRASELPRTTRGTIWDATS